jgi:hypothetical protein
MGGLDAYKKKPQTMNIFGSLRQSGQQPLRSLEFDSERIDEDDEARRMRDDGYFRSRRFRRIQLPLRSIAGSGQNGQGQLQPESAAPVWLAENADLAAHLFNQMLANHQTEACARLGAAIQAEAVEGTEQAGQ